MTPDTERCFQSLDPPSLDVVEVSGNGWAHLPWRSYEQLWYPEFDLCEPGDPGAMYDLVICEQVLEHVTDPFAAVKTLRRLCRRDGFVFVSTPFLVRLHDAPGDYWRFTPTGMEILLRSAGLEPLWVRSWGNRKAIVATFDRWVVRLPWNTRKNETHLPAVVWALAKPRQVDDVSVRLPLEDWQAILLTAETEQPRPLSDGLLDRVRRQIPDGSDADV
jgi:hypothetical protein